MTDPFFPSGGQGRPGGSMGAEESHGTPHHSTPARGPAAYGYSQSGYAQHAYTPYTQQQQQQYQHAYNFNHTPMRGAPHQFYGYHGGRGHVSPMQGGLGHVVSPMTAMQGSSSQMFQAVPFTSPNVAEGGRSAAAPAPAGP